MKNIKRVKNKKNREYKKNIRYKKWKERIKKGRNKKKDIYKL